MTTFERLQKPGPDQVKALEVVLGKADKSSPSVLYVAAAVALKEKRLEDSAFLFYAAQLRVRFDKECFPPKGTGADSPFIAYGAVGQQIGAAVNPLVMAEPKTFAAALARVKKWSPKTPEDYKPDYEFKDRKTHEEATKAADANRVTFLQHMGDLSTLLNDPDFFAAFRVVQDYNLSTSDTRPSKEAMEKAQATMERIEKAKGLKVFTEKQ